jgi:ribonuclease BN (tRNA processing enzyme)
VLYATDTEPGDPTSDHAIRELARDTDLLIYDSQYTMEQLHGDRKGWGHSGWEEGVRVCQEAGVKEFILFHHDPDRNDEGVDRLLATARSRFPNSRAAYEGLEIAL